MRRKLAAFIFILAIAAPSFAQTLFQGRIDVTVLDAQGRTVPGVLVEISGASSLSQTTDEAGEARFLNLPPGRYALNASLTGFQSYRHDNIEVRAGTSVPLKIALNVSGVKNPVVQIVDEANGEIVYTLRIAGQNWRPHVFAPGTYTVRVSEPETRRERVVKGVVAGPGATGTLDVRV